MVGKRVDYIIDILTSAMLPMGGEWIVTDGTGHGSGVVRSMSASTSLISSVKPFGRVLSDILVAWNFASLLTLWRCRRRRPTRKVKSSNSPAATLTIRYRKNLS